MDLSKLFAAAASVAHSGQQQQAPPPPSSHPMPYHGSSSSILLDKLCKRSSSSNTTNSKECNNNNNSIHQPSLEHVHHRLSQPAATPPSSSVVAGIDLSLPASSRRASSSSSSTTSSSAHQPTPPPSVNSLPLASRQSMSGPAAAASATAVPVVSEASFPHATLQRVLQQYQLESQITLNGPDWSVFPAFYHHAAAAAVAASAISSTANASTTSSPTPSTDQMLELISRAARFGTSFPGSGQQLPTTVPAMAREEASTPGKTLLDLRVPKPASVAPAPSTLHYEPFLDPPPFPIQQPPLLTPPDTSACERSVTMIQGMPITCFTVGGEKRLCFPQILNIVLREISLPQINAAVKELQIYCSTCSKEQMEVLKRFRDLPESTPSCGLITKTDAHRLCAALLPASGLPTGACAPSMSGSSKSASSPFAQVATIQVYHECFGLAIGRYAPSLYTKPSSACIQCEDCCRCFSPPDFVLHSHHGKENRTVHWGFDPANWRAYLLPVDDLQQYAESSSSPVKTPLHHSPLNMPLCCGGRKAFKSVMSAKYFSTRHQTSAAEVAQLMTNEEVTRIVKDMKDKFAMDSPRDTPPTVKTIHHHNHHKRKSSSIMDFNANVSDCATPPNSSSTHHQLAHPSQPPSEVQESSPSFKRIKCEPNEGPAEDLVTPTQPLNDAQAQSKFYADMLSLINGTVSPVQVVAAHQQQCKRKSNGLGPEKANPVKLSSLYSQLMGGGNGGEGGEQASTNKSPSLKSQVSYEQLSRALLGEHPRGQRTGVAKSSTLPGAPYESNNESSKPQIMMMAVDRKEEEEDKQTAQCTKSPSSRPKSFVASHGLPDTKLTKLNQNMANIVQLLDSQRPCLSESFKTQLLGLISNLVNQFDDNIKMMMIGGTNSQAVANNAPTTNGNGKLSANRTLSSYHLLDDCKLQSLKCEETIDDNISDVEGEDGERKNSEKKDREMLKGEEDEELIDVVNSSLEGKGAIIMSPPTRSRNPGALKSPLSRSASSSPSNGVVSPLSSLTSTSSPPPPISQANVVEQMLAVAAAVNKMNGQHQQSHQQTSSPHLNTSAASAV